MGRGEGGGGNSASAGGRWPRDPVQLGAEHAARARRACHVRPEQRVGGAMGRNVFGAGGHPLEREGRKKELTCAARPPLPSRSASSSASASAAALGVPAASNSARMTCGGAAHKVLFSKFQFDTLSKTAVSSTWHQDPTHKNKTKV